MKRSFLVLVAISAICSPAAGEPLTRTSRSGATVKIYVRDAGQPREEIIADARKQLRRQKPAWRLGACRLVIDYIEQMPVGKDTSWGTECVVVQPRRKAHAWLCDDRMVGKFTFAEAGRANIASLSNFVEDNCPPGG